VPHSVIATSTKNRWRETIINLKQDFEQRIASLAAKLQESERRHRTLLSNLPGMAYRCRNDSEWTMEFASEGSRNLLGVEPETLVAGHIPYHSLIHAEDVERIRHEVRSAISRPGAYALQYRVKHASGQWRFVWEQGRPILDNEGHVVALEGYIADMTHGVENEGKYRISEERLRRVQKMEAIGILAGGVAHDFNNVLAAILGSAELIKMDIEPGHPGREFLDHIFLAVNRAREVVQQVHTFSQQRECEHNVVDLQLVVKECVKLLRSTLPAMVKISCHIDPDCSPVLADPTQIHQIIMNLCTNAWQALPENHGHIKVSLEMCDLAERVTAGHPDLHAGPAVRLSIRDDGSGMSAATRARIFEPFFTTKPAGEGSGLGLSVVQGIVKAHQGGITVESEPGKGTVFNIYLPPQTGDETETPTESETVLSGNHERIMFVDDDELAGHAMEKLLSRLNYQIKWFKHPEAALAEFRARPAEYDLVITDLAMPGMTGDNLMAAMLNIRPNLPVLIITGLIDPAIMKRTREVGLGNVLSKPVSATALTREIAQRLTHRAESALARPIATPSEAVNRESTSS
jgi:PAS domain S-box-containing protein